MNAELMQVSWDEEFAGKTTEESCRKQILVSSINMNVPVKKVNPTAVRKNPWITNQLFNLQKR